MKITSFEEFKELARRGTFVPVVKEMVADLLTPVSAFLKIAEDADYAFLLESVEGGEHVGRYSFLGKDPFLILRARGDAHDDRTRRDHDRKRPAVGRNAAEADGRLPIAVRPGAAALHGRRGGLSRLRRGVVVRTGARRSRLGRRRRRRCRLHAVRHGAGLRSRAAPDPADRQRADLGGRRSGIAVPVRLREDSVPRAGARAQPVAREGRERRRASSCARITRASSSRSRSARPRRTSRRATSTRSCCHSGSKPT